MIIKHFFFFFDFTSAGQMIVRKSRSISITQVYKIGYMFVDANSPYKTLSIAMSDGMCVAYDNVEALCKALNEDEIGYRPMTSEEIADVMKEQGNRFSTL